MKHDSHYLIFEKKYYNYLCIIIFPFYLHEKYDEKCFRIEFILKSILLSFYRAFGDMRGCFWRVFCNRTVRAFYGVFDSPAQAQDAATYQLLQTLFFGRSLTYDERKSPV